PATNDVARVLGVLTCGGTVIVTNISGNALTAGDSFKLFNAASYGGSFDGIVLPPLNPGLGWNTNALNSSGVISVVSIAPSSPPVFNNVSFSGGNLIFAGTNGTAGASYYVMQSANLTMPMSNWTPIITNQFGIGGSFLFTNTTVGNVQQM